MQVSYHSQHLNFEAIEQNKCSITFVVCQSCVFVTILLDLQNKFIFSAKFETNNQPFDIIKFEQEYKIYLFLFRKIKVLYQSISNYFLVLHKGHENEFENSLNKIFFPTLELKLKKDIIPQKQIQNLYHSSQLDLKFVDNLHYKIKESHILSIFLNSTLKKQAQIYQNPHFIRILINDDSVSALLFKNNEFYLSKSLLIVSIEDATYNILQTISLLNINFENIAVYLNYFDNNIKMLELAKYLSYYFKEIQVENKPLAFDYDFQNQENLESHFLSPLFELALCEL